MATTEAQAKDSGLLDDVEASADEVSGGEGRSGDEGDEGGDGENADEGEGGDDDAAKKKKRVVRKRRTAADLNLLRDPEDVIVELTEPVLQELAGHSRKLHQLRYPTYIVCTHRNFQLRAIEGLVAALEPRARGPQVNGKAEVSRLREERDRLQRELQRANSLVRVAQRSIGLSAARSSAQRQKEKVKAKKAGKRGPRRPSVRARRAIKRLQPKDEGEPKPQKEAS